MYLADAHALGWYFTGDPRLGRKAARVFELSEKGEFPIVIPSIVLAELFHIGRKQRIGCDGRGSPGVSRPSLDLRSFSYNAWLGRVQRRDPRLVGFASVHPDEPDRVEQLDRAVSEFGLKGLKLVPCMQHYHLNDFALLEELAEHFKDTKEVRSFREFMGKERISWWDLIRLPGELKAWGLAA